MVHGAPIVAESRLSSNTNTTADPNPSGPASNSRFGGNGFTPGMIEGMKDNKDSVDIAAREDTSSDDAQSKQSDGIKSGSSSTSSSSQPKAGSPAGGSSIGVAPGAASIVSSVENLFGREQSPTEGALAKYSPKGGNASPSGKTRGDQGTGGTTNPTQTTGNVGSGGSKNGFAQASTEVAPVKRDTTGTEGAVVKTESRDQKVDAASNASSKSIPQAVSQAVANQSSSSIRDGSSDEDPADDHQEITEVSAEDKAAGGRDIRTRAKVAKKPTAQPSGPITPLVGVGATAVGQTASILPPKSTEG